MNIFLSKQRIGFIFFALLVLFILYQQANLPLWRRHLEIDVYVFYQRVEYFLKHHSFALLEGNEHFPGALLFFFSPLLFLTKFNYLNYLDSFFIVNLILLGLHFWLYQKQTNFIGQLLFLIILLASGPILLFRFELIVSLLIILCFYFWRKKQFSLAFFLLGLSTTIKIYPVLIFPYLIIVLLKNHRLQKLFSSLISFLGGLFSPLGIFFLLGGNFKQILISLQFHSAKPVSIESLPGVIITAFSLWVNKKPPTLIGGYGIWGIKTQFAGFMPTFFNWLWLWPVLLFYFFLFLNKRLNNKLNISIPFLLILIFLLFSKNLHPQYIFWFITLFPLLKFKKENDRLAFFALILIIVLLNQYVYPLLYTDFIKNFYSQSAQKEIFYLQTLRNFSILALLIFTFKNIFIKKTIS